MELIWQETLSLGMHPDAKLASLEHRKRNDFTINLEVKAFWSEPQRVLLVTGEVQMEDWARDLGLGHRQLLERLREREVKRPYVIRYVIGLADRWADELRKRISEELPHQDCQERGE